jgi:hypothetical protein
VQEPVGYNDVASGCGLDNQRIEILFPAAAIQVIQLWSAAPVEWVTVTLSPGDNVFGA